MNISAISMANSTVNFAGKNKKHNLEKGPDGQLGYYTRDGGSYVFFHPVKIEEPKEEMSIYEKGPNGELGVWSRQGEDAFFIPASEIEKRRAMVNAIGVLDDAQLAKVAGGDRESAQEYHDRKLYSTDWCM